MTRLALLVAALAAVGSPHLARAQVVTGPKDIAGTTNDSRGPASELYIRKRPTTPEAPVLSAELKQLLASTEKKRDDKRLEAIGLLRGFLASNPGRDGRAEGTFKLAELLWEEARRTYLIHMDDYARELEKCNAQKQACAQPKEPHIELKEPEQLYREIHDTYPQFDRMDLVTYLIGFAAKEDQREDEAMGRFQEVIDKYPKSPLYGDAWMMIGEHYFATAKWADARAAYKHVPDAAATSDLALFKTAWCEWKLGDSDTAAKDFKLVLDKASAAEKTGTEAQRRRSASLRDEALEYLVVVFTEDRSISAKEVFDFLASIGGEKYSRDVLVKVAESYGGQAEYERSNEAYRFLVQMDPQSIKAAEYQRKIIENWNSATDVDRAQGEIKILLDTYGPASAWAKAQTNREALERSLGTTEELVRLTANQMNAEAQRREKLLKLPEPKGCATKPTLPPDLLALYARAADAYGSYLAVFGAGKTPTPKSVELRYYRADILCFRLAKPEAAGDEYLAVGKTTPVGPLHKDALLTAMNAFELARPKDTQGKTQLYDVDKKFGEAIDTYATLFPADPQLVGVLFKNGQRFFDYGDYDEAIKRFGVIVTKYPDDANAGPAGDRILAALSKAQDYENIENWARKLKKAKSFAAADQQTRLDRLIVDSIMKSGDKYADAGKFADAAKFYLRVPTETHDNKLSAQALTNAGVMLEKAKQPEQAADIYLEVAEKYGDGSPDLAEKDAFAAGVVYEKVIYYDRAAKAYELVVSKFARGAKVADALYNAAVLRQALGQHKEAIAHYQEYARQFRDKRDAPDVAFNIGVVYEDSGDDKAAAAAYTAYAGKYGSTGKRLIEAHTRAARAFLKAGNIREARDQIAVSEKLYKSANGKERLDGKTWAAEARYLAGELILRDFEKVTLDVKPAQLQAALKTKSKLLAAAEKTYLSIAEFNDLKWATAALYRVGQVYDGFAAGLTDAANKPPPGLSADQIQAYQDAVNGYVVQIQDKAVEAFTTGYGTAIQMQVYNDYTAKIREALGRLASDKYPPEHEARTHERNGDRAPKLETISEVAR